MDELQSNIVAEVSAAMQGQTYDTSYTTVWRNLEDDLSRALCASLKRHIAGLTDQNCFTGVAGREKNRLADLAIVCGAETIEVSVKTARRSQEPSNDLGTFREHQQRQKLFVASFTLWGRYDDRGRTIKLDRVFFGRTYRFAGKSTRLDGVKYRKKDGNMRPMPWAMFERGESFWKTEKEFEAAVARAATYRANSIVKEHLRNMSVEDQRLLYEELKGKFE